MSLWTIDNVAEYLAIPNNEAWEVVREKGIPYVHYGKGIPDLTRRGARKIRFREEAVKKWAETQEQYWGDEIPVPVPALSEPSIRPGASRDSWQDIAGPTKLRGPRLKKS